MKQIMLFPLIVILLVFHGARAQQAQLPLPPATVVPHYLLPVSFNSTTVLVFSAAVKPVDRGDRDVLAQKQPGVENVLKLKAARKNFPETNLHVFTADGRIYAFDIVYTDSLASTRDLTVLPVGPGPAPSAAPVVIFSDQVVNTSELQHLVNAVRGLPSHHHGPVDRGNKMVLRLDKIGLAGSLMLFRLHISNHSNLEYRLDFIRLYVRDQQKAKRTSVQEREILPVYEDSVGIIPGDSAISHIIALPAFTLANGKQCVLEAYEKNGGRNLTLYIRNKSLLKARKL